MLYINLGNGKKRLGGSSLAQVYGQIGDESPDIEDSGLLKRTFMATQMLIEKDLILSGHDISDGGLIVALLEMAFSGNCGLDIGIEGQGARGKGDDKSIQILFSEEAGLVIEYSPDKEKEILEILAESLVDHHIIGRTLIEKRVKINLLTHHASRITVLDEDMQHLRELWEETSFQLERLQANPECADEEKKNIFERKGPQFTLTFTPQETPFEILKRDAKPKLAVIREEGSNGDREMTSAFYHSGFEVWDVTMTDILNEEVSLQDFKGVAFVGGFSYADVLDSAKGWAGVIKFNKKIHDKFQNFYNREDTFSLGVCNGCLLTALLGWVPWQGIADRYQPRFIHNRSGRFESRFCTVKILPGTSIMLDGMGGSILGIWVAHGEGMAHFPDTEIKQKVLDTGLAPVRYVNDNGDITESYPFNPNGSPDGIAALCSPDGRHLSIMPHPERTFLKWQWPWMPEQWRGTLNASPWIKIFQNARKWCD
jgi:phosphoribosylformylglycinamidine synthase